jgi:hypothetical protein
MAWSIVTSRLNGSKVEDGRLALQVGVLIPLAALGLAIWASFFGPVLMGPAGGFD